MLFYLPVLTFESYSRIEPLAKHRETEFEMLQAEFKLSLLRVFNCMTKKTKLLKIVQ